MQGADRLLPREEPFAGAARPLRDLGDVAAVVAFFTEGRRHT